MLTIPSHSNMLWHKWLENSYDLNTLMGMWNNLNPLVVIFIWPRKVLMSLVGQGGRRRVIGCLLILHLLLTFFFSPPSQCKGHILLLATLLNSEFTICQKIIKVVLFLSLRIQKQLFKCLPLTCNWKQLWRVEGISIKLLSVRLDGGVIRLIEM